MEENSAAVEILILFYINAKHVLKTKQMDERAFLELMIKFCRENGFDNYSDREICDTWKSLIRKFLKLKNNGTTEEKEMWKYYYLFDSCYSHSDFHSGVNLKFSDEMVWFLIEGFFKRRRLEGAEKKNTISNEVYKDFQRLGYLYITKQDIENKWKYLNVKYNKLKNDVVAFNKTPYLQALSGYHSKDDNPLVKMIFTKELTEILIERFTKKKVRCIIHGYDSDTILSEIQSEFRDLGYDFSQEEIKEEWRKLLNIYSFLKSKGRQESSWIYYNAMNAHFKNDYLFRISESQQKGVIVKRTKPTVRSRSKSVGAETKIKQDNMDLKANLVVNVEKLSPSSKKEISKNLLPFNKKKTVKKRHEDAFKKSKMPKIKLKYREDEEIDEIMEKTDEIYKNNPESKNSVSRKRNLRLSKLSIENNVNREKRRSNDDIASPNSKVHIINVKESEINKNNGNLTINLPSITKQFSDNEFLPLKKRLRLGVNQGNQINGTDEIKDGFLEFPPSETENHEIISDASQSKRLSEEEMAAIIERVNAETSAMECVTAERSANSDLKQENSHINDSNYYKQDTFSYNYDDTYNNVNQNRLLVPKEECHENVPVQSYNTHATTPPPVLLVVIKVDGSKNSIQNGGMSDARTETENKKNNTIDNHLDQRVEAITNDIPVFSNSTDISGKNNMSNVSTETLPSTEKNIEMNNTQMDESELLSSDINVYEELISTENNNSIKPCNGPVFVGEKNSPSKINTNKSIKLPVKSGGELKEISISPKEFSKLAKASRNVKSFVQPKISKEYNKVVTTPNSKIKFISQVIKPATSENVVMDSKLEKNDQNAQTDCKPKQSINFTASDSMPPPSSLGTSKKTSNWSSNCSSLVISKNEEFENESIFSEATVDDDALKDNLLATVIDFQEQNNQEFVEIKNLMKQNNLLQRETNRLLRLMLEKM